MVEFTLVDEPFTMLGAPGWYAIGDRDRCHKLAPSLELDFYQITFSQVEGDSDMPDLGINVVSLTCSPPAIRPEVNLP